MAGQAEQWHVEYLGDAHGVETNHWYGIGCDSGTGRVAKVEGFGETAKARAYLIAQSPKLLAACKALVAALEHGAVPGRLVSEARTIIAGAEPQPGDGSVQEGKP